MLSYWDKNGLMIGSGIDGGEFVNTSGETFVDGSSKDAALCCSIQTLEECEDVGVGRGCLIKSAELLDDNVRMAFDLTLTVQLLGC